MLTKKDLHEFITELREILHTDLARIEKKIDLIGSPESEYGKGMNLISKKLDKFISILNRFSKKQEILEAKMQLIEEYFNPHPHN